MFPARVRKSCPSSVVTVLLFISPTLSSYVPADLLISLTTYNSRSVFVISPDRHFSLTVYPLTLPSRHSPFLTLSLSSLHHTVSALNLAQVNPTLQHMWLGFQHVSSSRFSLLNPYIYIKKTKKQVSLSVVHLQTVFIHKHTPAAHPNNFISCSQMTALAELKGQNDKKRKYIKGQRHKHSGGCVTICMQKSNLLWHVFRSYIFQIWCITFML